MTLVQHALSHRISETVRDMAKFAIDQ